MPKTLTGFQRKVLKEIGESELSRFFIWSGGTALSYRYLHHRLSADLDFMSQDLFPDDYLLSQIKKIAKNLRIKKIEEQKKFNRHGKMGENGGKMGSTLFFTIFYYFLFGRLH